MSSVEAKVNEFKQAKQDFDIFDTSLWWAPYYAETFVRYTDIDKLYSDHAGYGINGGLFTTRYSAFNDYKAGTQESIELTKGHDNYHPVAVIVPEMFYNDAEGFDELKKLQNQGVVAARIYPGRFAFSTKEYSVGAMCKALEELDMPLMLWHIDTGWDAMDEICTNHPKLKVVVDSEDRKLLYHQRDYINLMKKHENFYVENHNLVLFNELDVIDKYCGSEHLMFGSYFPYMNPDLPLYTIFASCLSDEKKQLIYSGNAKRVFNIK